jgi:hypothetical protein
MLALLELDDEYPEDLARPWILLVDGEVGTLMSASAVRVQCCVGSSLELESGVLGLGRVGSSSDDWIVGSCSEGRLSPSNSWMSSLATPRYGFPEVESCSSSCHWPPNRVTALFFFPEPTGGLNRRMSYPRLFRWSSADTKVMCSLFACADLILLRAM